jgi:hypothetical protein
MMRRGLFALALLALAAGGAVAKDAAKPAPVAASDYPAAIRESLDNAAKECREADDGKLTPAPDMVRKIDLTGDGRDDYLVSFEDMECSTFESIFCGTGGCLFEIYVALGDGSLRSVFSNPVREYKILPGKGARTIRFDMHGGYCGTYGAAECIKKQRITDKPFTFKDR